jgi:hypothetical protein
MGNCICWKGPQQNQGLNETPGAMLVTKFLVQFARSFRRLPESACPFVQELLEIWCHGCAEGSSVQGRVRRDVQGIMFPCWRGINRPSGNNRQARMNPAGRDASVAPDPIAALLYTVVTDGSWLFAAMTEKGRLPYASGILYLELPDGHDLWQLR